MKKAISNRLIHVHVYKNRSHSHKSLLFILNALLLSINKNEISFWIGWHPMKLILQIKGLVGTGLHKQTGDLASNACE